MKVVLPVPPSYHVQLKSNATLFKVKERSTDMQRKYRAQKREMFRPLFLQFSDACND